MLMPPIQPLRRVRPGEFPGGPVVRTLFFHCPGPRFNPWPGNYDPASHMKQPKKRERDRNHSPCTGMRKSPVQFSSVVQSCPTPCSPTNHSTPGLPVHHQLPESNQTHVHQVSDAIQQSHPLLSPSPPALNLS